MRKFVSSSKVSHSSSTTPWKSTTCALCMILVAPRASERMIDTSSAIVSRTPGRCTLTATSSPVSSVARCTCASEAEPSGVGSIFAKISSTGRRYSFSSVSSTIEYGMGSASARSFASSSQNDCGRISDRIERICPTLTNVGPSASNMRRILTGVSPLRASNCTAILPIWCRRLILLRRVRWYSLENDFLRAPNRPIVSSSVCRLNGTSSGIGWRRAGPLCCCAPCRSSSSNCRIRSASWASACARSRASRSPAAPGASAAAS